MTNIFSEFRNNDTLLISKIHQNLDILVISYTYEINNVATYVAVG